MKTGIKTMKFLSGSFKLNYFNQVFLELNTR